MKLRDIVQSVFEAIDFLIGTVVVVAIVITAFGGWMETLVMIATLAVVILIYWIATIIRRAIKGYL